MDQRLNALQRQLKRDPQDFLNFERIRRCLERIGWRYKGLTIEQWQSLREPKVRDYAAISRGFDCLGPLIIPLLTKLVQQHNHPLEFEAQRALEHISSHSPYTLIVLEHLQKSHAEDAYFSVLSAVVCSKPTTPKLPERLTKVLQQSFNKGQDLRVSIILGMISRLGKQAKTALSVLHDLARIGSENWDWDLEWEARHAILAIQ